MPLSSVLFGLASVVSVVAAQSEECYSAGGMLGAILVTIAAIVALLVLAYFLWRFYWKGRRGKHLVLVTDTEKGGDYAFDNPGFKEGTPIGRTGTKEDSNKQLRWQSWAPLSGLAVAGKPRALDDSYVGQPLMTVVPLRSHDFTGLGFNICGNMRDGIFVKDVLHRGPASESGRIVPGDRIESIRISFRHMVFEDALTILSYASPYEVQLEVENGSSSRPATLLRNKRASVSPAERICHPFYRSHSISDLIKINKSNPSKWANETAIADLSNGDLPKPAVIDTSPIEKMQKVGVRVLPPTINSETLRIEAEKSQNARNSVIESGQVSTLIKKSPSNTLTKPDKSPSNTLIKTRKSPIPLIKHTVSDFDEIDLSDGRDDKMSQGEGSRKNTPSPGLKETNVKSFLVKGYNNLKEKLHHAGLKLEKETEEELQPKKNDVPEENGIVESKSETVPVSKTQEKPVEKPEVCSSGEAQDIPEEVQKAGMAARNNRKSVIEDGKSWDRPVSDVLKDAERGRKDSISGDSSNEGDAASQKKSKRKAPPPPPTKPEDDLEPTKAPSETDEVDSKDSLSEKNNSMDSVDTDSEQGDKSGTTIELNSSHITVHHAPDSETSRKAASMGDLSRIGNDQPIVVLERAVSLDLADGTPGGGKKRKAPLPPQEEFSDDGGMTYSKEARIDSAVHTRLKHSSDFGRLEDAVKLNEHVSDEDSDQGVSGLSTPEPSLPMMISSTPMKHDFFIVPPSFDSQVNASKSSPSPPLSPASGLSGVHVSRCSWDLSVPESTTEQFVTAINGNNTEDEDDIPPELPTSPIPTYVTEIQVVTANKDGTQGFLENGQSELITRDDIFPKNIPEMSSFMTNNIHKPFSTFNNNPFSVSTRRSEVSVINSNQSDDMNSLPSLANLSDTMMAEVNQVSLSQPNSLDPILQGDLAMTIKDLRLPGTLIFSNENMSDEQILAMKSSPEPILIDTSQSKTQVSKPARSNVSVTSIRAGSSRIPIRAVPEPTQRKTKRENYVSFSSLNVSPANDKRHTNGSGENSITHIVLDSQK
uniref:PDZ domain-containing protein n=1 Tax=Graphocephala atropunctata TaxID=36148 RepID=A0A1B6M3H7_9HEMI